MTERVHQVVLSEQAFTVLGFATATLLAYRAGMEESADRYFLEALALIEAAPASVLRELMTQMTGERLHAPNCRCAEVKRDG